MFFLGDFFYPQTIQIPMYMVYTTIWRIGFIPKLYYEYLDFGLQFV
jgi:hypothetical protein